MRKPCAAGSAASSSARASASVLASGKMRRPKIVPARAISAFHCPLSLPAASRQVTMVAVDRRRARARGRLPCGELDHACGRGPGRGRAGRGHQLPDIGRLPEIVGRDMAQQQGGEHALPGIVAQIAREHGVGDFEPGRLVGEPRAEDQPVAAIGQVVRQREGLFGQARQAVAHFRGQRREQRQADRHVGDHGRRQRRIEPVDHADGRLGHDHRAPDGDEQADPLRIVLPRAAEGGAEQDPGETGYARQLRQRHIGAARRDGGHRVQQVDQVGPAAEGVELVHYI